MPNTPYTIIATDCGSTTTKAILIEGDGQEYRLVARGEAPTTVEAPFDDVTVGVLNAVGELEDLTGRTFIRNGRLIVPRESDTIGMDLYLSTSSAGGGLQMLVAGVVKSMTAESAQRAALGAGAIVIDTLAVDDGRKEYQRVERIRGIRPDMILLSGGTDGGTTQHLLDLAETLRAADPKPRLGESYRLPVVFAGNTSARDGVEKILGDKVSLEFVDNLRPVLERENLQPSRDAIHELFLRHVMAQAPGYDKLLGWVSYPVMSTPHAVGLMVQAASEARNTSVLAVDIGGATTDVFSVFGGTFNRTVSANLGMSYSVCNVLAEANTANIKRWVPEQMNDFTLRNRLRNKMIRPTTIPQAREDLLVEQAVAREALRLAFIHHQQLASGLKGVQQQRDISAALNQGESGASLVNMFDLGLIIGSGGVLSHAPRRHQSALMMIDAFQPMGVTMLAVDSIFMMPQLGVLSDKYPDIAYQVFQRDCLIPLGPCVAPLGPAKDGEDVMTVSLESAGEAPIEVTVHGGELINLPLPVGQKAKLVVRPTRSFDLGEGKGKVIEEIVDGGVVGVILDGRGRPLQLPDDDTERNAKLLRWLQAIGAVNVNQV
ncbi:MAG TPA: glutamate mutase L [Armatimonadota bacterium]|nr:glutamate mutase L [Armatimonadota bacterium]